VRLPEWRINCHRAWAVLHLQLGSPPGAGAARSCGVGCRPPGDVGTDGQYTAVSSNPAIAAQEGCGRPDTSFPARGCVSGPGQDGGAAFLEIAGARALDWRSLESGAAGPGGPCVGEQARLAPWRSGLSRRTEEPAGGR
jgi:hypothetical protein